MRTAARWNDIPTSVQVSFWKTGLMYQERNRLENTFGGSSTFHGRSAKPVFYCSCTVQHDKIRHVMSDRHIHLPPMPKPQDFGITDETWVNSQQNDIFGKGKAARAQIQAYKDALAAWKETASAVGNQS
jgi:hypothetical protein